MRFPKYEVFLQLKVLSNPSIAALVEKAIAYDAFVELDERSLLNSIALCIAGYTRVLLEAIENSPKFLHELESQNVIRKLYFLGDATIRSIFLSSFDWASAQPDLKGLQVFNYPDDYGKMLLGL